MPSLSESIGILGSKLNGVYPRATVIEAEAVTSAWQSKESQTVRLNSPSSLKLKVSPEKLGDIPPSDGVKI